MSPSPIPMTVFAQEFMTIYEGPKYAQKTRKKMLQVLNEVQQIGIKSTADLTTLRIAEWVKWKSDQANPNTVNGLIDYLRAACNYAVEEGYLGRCPTFRRVRPRPKKPTLNRPLTYDEAATLLARFRAGAVEWEGRRIYALFSLILLTGIRFSEAIYARVGDLDLDARILRVPEREKRLKTYGSDRHVPLPEVLCHVLREWFPHVGKTDWLFPGVKRLGPWTGGMPGRKAIHVLQREAVAASIDGVTWHGLRHTFGSHALLYHQQPIWVVQAILGHTDLRTTQRYLHLGQPAILAESVRSISYRIPEQRAG